jgi:hypothetical protein
MQIHGCDLTIPTKFNHDDTMSHAINAIRDVWGSVVIEIESPPEIFVYKSKDALDAWEALGWNMPFAKDMVHLKVILDRPGELTIVLEDNQDPTLSRVLESITKVLKP